MKYRVIETFVDLQNGGHRYNAGDDFPADGISVSEKRIESLLSSENRRKKPLIEAIESTQPIESIDSPVHQENDVREQPSFEDANETFEDAKEIFAEKPRRGRKKK